jgi:RNA polymerase sigma factor (sigma-70 family)
MIQSGSEKSALSEQFTQLFALHAPSLRRYCARKVQDEQLAEDITQEAFLRALLYVRTGRVITSAPTFLRKIVDNLIIDEIRRNKGQAGVSLDVLHEKGFDPGYDSLDGWQKVIEVGTIIEGLRKKEAKLLSMRYLEGLQPADIAARIGITPNTVAMRLHRIMKRLTVQHRKTSAATITVEPL